MKALVINKPGELQVKDLSTPAIAADEVLVRMRAVGICHSDYELYSGKYIIPIAYPVTPGHEWAGEIVETGKAVGDIKSGDRVVGECVIESGDRSTISASVSMGPIRSSSRRAPSGCTSCPTR